MKTINNFWYYFSLIQGELIFAINIGDEDMRDEICEILGGKLNAINPKLTFLIDIKRKYGPPIFIFITKGESHLELLAEELLVKAPSLPLWSYKVGIKPYESSCISLCAAYDFLPKPYKIHQIYFALLKIYPSSNKLHLLFYFEMGKQLPKSYLQNVMDTILLFFLGDALYHRHISRYRIVRRKFSRIRFIPLDELKHIIQFKAIN